MNRPIERVEPTQAARGEHPADRRVHAGRCRVATTEHVHLGEVDGEGADGRGTDVEHTEAHAVRLLPRVMSL